MFDDLHERTEIVASHFLHSINHTSNPRERCYNERTTSFKRDIVFSSGANSVCPCLKKLDSSRQRIDQSITPRQHQRTEHSPLPIQKTMILSRSERYVQTPSMRETKREAKKLLVFITLEDFRLKINRQYCPHIFNLSRSLNN